MKTLILSVLIIISNLSLSQQTTNEQIAEWATAQVGKKKVGGKNGLCYHLVYKALKKFSVIDGTKKGFYGGYKKAFGTPVAPEDVIPGDIMLYKGAKFEWDKEDIWGDTIHIVYRVASHIEIITKVKGNGKFGSVHQNVGDSKFIEDTGCDLNYLTKGKVLFYRPRTK